jgi:hypothetical protein
MAPRIVAWSILGLVLIVLLAAAWFTPSGRTANAAKQGGSELSPPEIGRFQLVRQSTEEIILLDTISGDLYRAGPGDIKPYADRNKDDEDEAKDSNEE